MLTKTLFTFLIVSVLLLPVNKSSQTPQYDLLIKRGRSVDKGQRTAALAGRVLRGPGHKR